MASQGFQTQVNAQQAAAVEGDFASSNPRTVVLAGQFGLVAGPNGVTVGRFAWATNPADNDEAPSRVDNAPTLIAAPTGFCARSPNKSVITAFLGAATMLIPAGFPVTLFNGGDFFVKNNGAAYATPGMKAFASLVDGSVTFAAAGTILSSASGTSASIASTTLTLVGSIADNVLTVASVSAGTVYPGAKLTSNGAGFIVRQLTGTAGAAGTYLLDTGEQSVAAGTTIGGNYGLLTNGTMTGTFAVGMQLSGTNVVAGTVITFLPSGTTSVVNNNTVVSSTTITGSSSVETKFFARSSGAQNELVKISSYALG